MTTPELIYEQVKRRLDALQEATKLPRARCIGLLDAEYADEHKARIDALNRLFAEASAPAAQKRPQSPEEGRCSYCGLPANSPGCQKAHP